jgi:hypothetical protein
MEAATTARFQAHSLSPTPRPVFNTSKSERSFFQSSSVALHGGALLNHSWNASHHLGHGLSHVLSLMHPHTCHQALLDRVTACVSHTDTDFSCVIQHQGAHMDLLDK